MPITPGTRGDTDTRRPPRTSGTDDDALRGLAGNLVGGADGLDDVRGVEPGEASLLDRDVPLPTSARMAGAVERASADGAPTERADNATSQSSRDARK
jgi:hypothetical protein